MIREALIVLAVAYVVFTAWKIYDESNVSERES